MDRDDTVLDKVLQNLSSASEKNGHMKDVLSSREIKQEYLDSYSDLVRNGFGKGRKSSSSLKSKTTDQLIKKGKSFKSAEQKKPPRVQALSTNIQPQCRKQPRKGENPVRISLSADLSTNNGSNCSLICKNSACRAILRPDDTFCKRCSCCICHLFDDNKDPSLWLVCTSEAGEVDSCGLSCHLECAIQRGKAGVVNLGTLMHLDGSYCCASCGKVSGIIGSWKKQLVVAKDARRVDVLCYRIALSHRLLDGTSKFKELHNVVENGKNKLETEVGPLNGVSLKMGRGIVSRLSVCNDVQELCSLAVEKADEWISTTSTDPCQGDGSLPAACKFVFEDVTSSSLVVVLKEIASFCYDSIKGFKLWYCKSSELPYQKDPVTMFPRNEQRFRISNLQPCTEYAFCIISFTEVGDLGHSEAKCFTRSVEIIHKSAGPIVQVDSYRENPGLEGSSSTAKREAKTNGSSGFRVRNLGKILEMAWAQEGGRLDEFCSAAVEECRGLSLMKPEGVEERKRCAVSCELDLNIASVPDLNADITPPLESSRDEEDIGCTSERVVEAEDDINFGGLEKNGEVRSNGSGDSIGRHVKVPAVESRTRLSRKRSHGTNEEAYDGDSTLVNWAPFFFADGPNRLDGSYENCLKAIRWLERGGHIKMDFRVNFFTWLSLFSTEQERRVVDTYIKTLEDDPACLAGQLVDSFEEIVLSKRPRNGFCSKLWH